MTVETEPHKPMVPYKSNKMLASRSVSSAFGMIFPLSAYASEKLQIISSNPRPKTQMALQTGSKLLVGDPEATSP